MFFGKNFDPAQECRCREMKKRSSVLNKRPRVRTRYFQGKEQKARRCPMRTLFHLSESQLELIKPFFPRSHGALRVDDRCVASGIIYVIKHGLQWQDAPDEVRTQCCTTALSGGVGSVFSIKFSLSWQIKHLLMAPWWSTPPISRLTARRQVCSKRGFSTSHRSHKRRTEFQTSCRLWRPRAARPAFADWRAGQRLQRCRHSPAPPSRYLYVSGRRRLWRELAAGISESQGDGSLDTTPKN